MNHITGKIALNKRHLLRPLVASNKGVEGNNIKVGRNAYAHIPYQTEVARQTQEAVICCKHTMYLHRGDRSKQKNRLFTV